ncbi:MAG: hypothetical protein B6242_05275 [Anaerolineaceae bacterium 4572_78]|nr:MAG: hypothetical protein B6242_05275 [Anaerolineaceae bacterium 4572_78]
MNKLAYYQMFIIVVIIALLSSLFACAAAEPLPEQSAPFSSQSISNTPTSIPTPTNTIVPSPPDTDELANLVMSGLYPDALLASDNTEGIVGIAIKDFQLSNISTPFWAITSYTFRNVETQNHFVAVYTHNDNQWQEISRLDLESMPDYMHDSPPHVVEIEPDLAWIEIDGAVGAHSTVYEIVSFDGKNLNSEITSFNSSGEAGYLKDINEDGTLEVILNLTENYIFCYACGVRKPIFDIVAWNGSELLSVSLEFSTNFDPKSPDALNNKAVQLGQVELWMDAQTIMDEALAQDSDNPVFKKNGAIIKLHADAHKSFTENSPYPILNYIFYGDYDSAMNQFRPYTPSQIFTLDSPLIIDTVAQGWEPELVKWIKGSVEPTLELDPMSAESNFFLAWAAYLADPNDIAVFTYLEKAMELDPEEMLYGECLSYLR